MGFFDSFKKKTKVAEVVNQKLVTDETITKYYAFKESVNAINNFDALVERAHKQSEGLDVTHIVYTKNSEINNDKKLVADNFKGIFTRKVTFRLRSLYLVAGFSDYEITETEYKDIEKIQ